MDLPRHLTVISPHLDDAVLGCGTLIAATGESRVVTIFAGIPHGGMPAPPWDQAAGFSCAREAVIARRHEDVTALALVGARPQWLDFLDAQYGIDCNPADVANQLRSALPTLPASTVAVPMGLFHSDHRLAHDACMILYTEAVAEARIATALAGDAHEIEGALRWIFYEDAIYRRLPGLVQRRLAGWERQGRIATPVYFPEGECHEMKVRAMASYASQMALFNAEQREDIAQPERYWSLSEPPGTGTSGAARAPGTPGHPE